MHVYSRLTSKQERLNASTLIEIYGENDTHLYINRYQLW